MCNTPTPDGDNARCREVSGHWAASAVEPPLVCIRTVSHAASVAVGMTADTTCAHAAMTADMPCCSQPDTPAAAVGVADDYRPLREASRSTGVKHGEGQRGQTQGVTPC